MRIRQIPITLDFPAEAPPCCCGENPSCGCGDLPSTLYARLTKYQWVAGDGVFDTELGTFDVTLNEGDPPPTAGICPAEGSRTWWGEFETRDHESCEIVGRKYQMQNILTLHCANAGAALVRLTLCTAWHKLVTCPDGYAWQGPIGSQSEIDVIDCREPVFAEQDFGTVPFGHIVSIQVSESAFV